MKTGRMEAFSDGVIAISITVMVLKLDVPEGADWQSLRPLLPVFLVYVLSFVNLGIFWNNHHHLLYAAKYVNGTILWSNMHLLFWLSLIPFATGWMGENHFAPLPTALYGAVLFAAAISYYILEKQIIRQEGTNSALAAAVGSDFKGKFTPLIYVIAIALAFVNQYISDALYVAAALMWFIPDRRIESKLIELKES